jgi:Domain of Unknown Function (DUF1080)
MRFTICLFLSFSVGVNVAMAVDPTPVPMFNGKDLSGWTIVNGAKSTWGVTDGTVITSGKPIGFMRTDKHYENFILEMDWMHINKKEVGNSGVFVWGDARPAVGTGYTRGIEVQVLVNYPDVGWATNHGDIFSIWGAKCKPDRPHPKGYERCLPRENRCKGGGEWNHYKITAKDGRITLDVNGKEVSGVSECSPRKGYLALEAEGAECQFKNVMITELPTSHPKKDQIATLDQGHVILMDGLTMTGWKTDDSSWTISDGVFKSKGQADLKTGTEYAAGELVFDWKLPDQSKAEMKVTIGNNQSYSYTNRDLSRNDGKWHRTVIKMGPAGVEFATDELGFSKSTYKIDAGPIAFSAATGLEIRSVFLKP